MTRHRRPRSGRWEDPVSLLQAARYERRWDQIEVCHRVQGICPGHRPGMPCGLQPSKLSEWEHGQRYPNMTHVIALCRVYVRHEARCFSGGVRDPTARLSQQSW